MSSLLLVFAAVLLVAVLVSALAKRTILSTAVVFLVAGFLAGPGVAGAMTVRAGDPLVSTLAELALFSVLFSDGMKVGWPELRSAWRLPGRALLLGMPFTMIFTAGLAYWLTGLNWVEALLVGAILAPTDPVFAAALVGNDRVPARLRYVLNVESGLNDGLALPFVLVFLALAGGDGGVQWGTLTGELAVGLAIGVIVPWAAIKLEALRWFEASGTYAPLNAVAIGLLVLALGLTTHGNLYLAAFAAGVTVATCGPRQREAFGEFGELLAELLKLAALLVFGALMAPSFVAEIPLTGWVFVIAAIVVARPAALLLSFLGSELSPRERLAAAWFGPKGFASVVYGLLVVSALIPAADTVFHLVAVTIAVSIVAHSSTDIIVARWFDDPASSSTTPDPGRPTTT